MMQKTFLDKTFFAQGTKMYVPIDFAKVPHIALFGASGSGKTYATKLLLAKIAKQYNDACFIIADYKGDNDFAFLNGLDYFFRFERADDWFDQAINILVNRQNDIDVSRNFVLLCFDELAAYLMSLDKKTREDRIQKLSRLLMLGRSFNINVIVSQQRPDAVYFGQSRDNFGTIVTLGKLSKEMINMLYSFDKHIINSSSPRGEGYMQIAGQEPVGIIVPKYDIVKANAYIYEACLRTSQYNN